MGKTIHPKNGGEVADNKKNKSSQNFRKIQVINS